MENRENVKVLDRMCTIYRTIITEPFDIGAVVFLNSWEYMAGGLQSLIEPP